MSKITITAPKEILRNKVERFIQAHYVLSVEYHENLAIIVYT